jgi:hypothetical protein
MWILLGVLAVLIGSAGYNAYQPSQEQPADQFELPLARVGGGVPPERVTIKPYSEFKYQNIVRQAYDYSCGSAALVTLLNHYLGIWVDEKQAMEGMLAHGEAEKIVARRGFSLLDMKRYVATLGVEAAGFRADVTQLAQLTQPAIVPIHYAGFKHFVIVRGVRGGKVFIADPSAGHLVVSTAEFEQIWGDRNTLFVLYPPEGQSEAALLAHTVRRLALSNEELGVIDGDLVRAEVVFPQLDRTEALQRAVESGLGNFQLRR